MQKTAVTIIRHGETEWNVALRLQGIQDSPLTPEGIKQAGQLAESLRQEKFDVMISSDLGRAVRTAEIIAAKTRLEIIRDSALRERNFGVMEGMTREEAFKKYPEVFSSYSKRKETYKIKNGESLVAFNKRVREGLDRILHTYPDKNILIVSHGGVLDCVIRMVFNYPLSSFRSFSIYNTAINRFSVSDNKWVLEEWGNTDHLSSQGSMNEFS
ncbi:MAG: histidine phosphatase family protein [Bacteroidales bacterium]|jgi:probable phosphoglycerate mutase